MKRKVIHNSAGLGIKKGMGPHVPGIDMTKSPTWFRIMDSNIKGMVFGEEIILPLGVDFPLDLTGKPVVIVQHGKAPTICKITGVDELLQLVKVELFLGAEKPNVTIAAKSIFRIFEITWYCGEDLVPKPVQSMPGTVLDENSIRLLCNKKESVKSEGPTSIDYLRQPVTAEEIKTRKSMDQVNNYLTRARKKGLHK